MKLCSFCEFLNDHDRSDCQNCSKPLDEEAPVQTATFRVPFDTNFFLIEQVMRVQQEGRNMDLEDSLLDALEILDKEKERFARFERQMESVEEDDAIHDVKTALSDIEALLAEALEGEEWQSSDWEDWRTDISSAIEMLEVSSVELPGFLPNQTTPPWSESPGREALASEPF